MSKMKEHILNIREKCQRDIETLDDGYKCWWPLHGSGYMTAFDLRIIADYLDELNKDWDTLVKKELSNEQ